LLQVSEEGELPGIEKNSSDIILLRGQHTCNLSATTIDIPGGFTSLVVGCQQFPASRSRRASPPAIQER
jgi:hypothetical protein